MEGITINSWKIIPLIRPVVSSCDIYVMPAHILAITSGDQEAGGQLQRGKIDSMLSIVS